jgi:hypothetical protein
MERAFRFSRCLPFGSCIGQFRDQHAPMPRACGSIMRTWEEIFDGDEIGRIVGEEERGRSIGNSFSDVMCHPSISER